MNMSDLYLKAGDAIVKLPNQIPILDAEITSLPHKREIILNKEDKFSASIPKSSLYKLCVISGLKHRVPNNWLRFHGYPMNRR